MKELTGSASAAVEASVAECIKFLRDVDRYPAWHPGVVRRVEVLERDGGDQATRARSELHVAVGPLVKDFNIILAITEPDQATVKLSRVPHHSGDEERFEVVWRVREAGRTRLDLQLAASLPIPRFLPVSGIGDNLANGFVANAAKALRGS
jgi:hypothetical protein